MRTRMSDNSRRTYHQQLAQVAVALFGNSTKPVFTSCRVLTRHKTNPGSELPARLERTRIGNGCRDCRCTKNTNAWDCFETPNCSKI